MPHTPFLLEVLHRRCILDLLRVPKWETYEQMAYQDENEQSAVLDNANNRKNQSEAISHVPPPYMISLEFCFSWQTFLQLPAPSWLEGGGRWGGEGGWGREKGQSSLNKKLRELSCCPFLWRSTFLYEVGGGGGSLSLSFSSLCQLSAPHYLSS